MGDRQELMETECKRLTAALDEAYMTIKAKDEDLMTSATLGKRLLETNSELSARLDVTMMQSAARIEV